ncbi:shikimate kinase [Actinacidiphila yanglinensis]|uniref:Shikimate kinase n=1 Tax=Actinacidiphila yanglinensis TaxID=310779 RepID=A0A1H5XT43_9ACTN|nr:AAA family ATPase [Actinacidiphila yanglinensis]SEG14891.1 shikimate kinase [Actinacidiphila yanglinensis]
MIVWLNGTFGAGKTTTSKLLTEMLPDARIFDSEYVGYMLQPFLTDRPVRDFQDHPPWRPLVVQTAVHLLDYVGGTLVVPQSVLVQAYWTELSAGLAEAGLPVHHFVLHADPAELARRIERDTVETAARKWRLDHLADYEAALPWLREAGTVVDTETRTPEEVARQIAAEVTRAAAAA